MFSFFIVHIVSSWFDFRKYKIIVENNYGEGVFNFTLQSASKYICNYKQYV
jgi:hypothetical protein